MVVAVERVSGSGVPFSAVGPADAVSVINGFLSHLWSHGRGSYTIRSYAFGTAHFATWMDDRGIGLWPVTRQTLATYLDEFRRGTDAVAGTAPSIRLKPRSARTVNHRLSVITSFLGYVAEQEQRSPEPVSCTERVLVGLGHRSIGRDPPARADRNDLTQRAGRRLPSAIDPCIADELVRAAGSWRNKALLTLLLRTGQRIGDWHEVHGQHGLLGLRLTDVDARSRTVLVRLKGARDEHRVPVTDDFWPLWNLYLVDERGCATTSAAWVGVRRGKNRPLTYSAFERSLRHAAAKLGVDVNAHMFRHAFAKAVVETSGLKVAQELLGHRFVSTTADSYLHVDEQAMVDAVIASKRRNDRVVIVGNRTGFVFDYDEITIAELDALTTLPERIGPG